MRSWVSKPGAWRRYLALFKVCGIASALVLCPRPCFADVASAAPPDPLAPWNDIAAVAAVVISLAALMASLITTHAKTLRERREELKDCIETLIKIQTKFATKAGTFASEPEREYFSSTMQTRKSIYLESAEHLAIGLPYVTPAEWIVLGSAHMLDSNFHRAEQMYQRAVAAAKQSAAVTQAAARRSLAQSRMMQGPAVLESARRTFGEAVSLLTKRTDPYSLYNVALTFRLWAEMEFVAGHVPESRARLGDALDAARRMPDGFDYKGFEVRRCAADLMIMSDSFLSVDNAASAREVLDLAMQQLAPLKDGFSADARAQTMVRRAHLESLGGDVAASSPFIEAARAALAALPPKSPALSMPFAQFLLAPAPGGSPSSGVQP